MRFSGVKSSQRNQRKKQQTKQKLLHSHHLHRQCHQCRNHIAQANGNLDQRVLTMSQLDEVNCVVLLLRQQKRGLNFYFCKGGGGSAYRSGRGNRGLPTHQPSHQQVASWGKQSKPIQSSETNAVDKGGSWASIASAPKPQPATTNDNSWNDVSANNSWEAPTSTSDGWGAAAASTVNDEWSKPSWDTTTETSVNHSTQNHESSETKNNSSISAEPTPSSPAPKTWASLLKYVHRISDHNGFRKP